ncbi:hypothetical protein ACTRW9_12765 [Nitrospina sp. 32_T5]
MPEGHLPDSTSLLHYYQKRFTKYTSNAGFPAGFEWQLETFKESGEGSFFS